ncbi:hypothetical protein MIND_01373300 [Mycena indigotica]|uniref:Uncharacterized protein n=1 Tax=Mycena indigotica TaxID=2126181 RepID=A0A8H6S0H6_9AGAR|nr:uncharacterized protein MIND_01373300 [Mycena indigotica]KAF7289980.1 hypothetical protein MIND_01373300 [Mycena indigotica]
MASWHTLPTELHLQIVECLEEKEARTFSAVNLQAYRVCVPLLFRHVHLQHLDSFVNNVPRAYYRHIHTLELHVNGHIDALSTLLTATPCLTTLVLHLNGSIEHDIIPAFLHARALRSLTIRNVSPEVLAPLSERLVVSIAASVPELHHLHLERISRSVLHAPELVGKHPFVPLVAGDSDIPHHPTLGASLNLPSLLSIPSLKQLTIHDTHLGDPMWTTTPVLCNLQMLDLGSCAHEPSAPNRLAIERIMSAVGPSLSAFSLPTALEAPPPLPRLRSLHISPFVPPDQVVDTVAALAESPIEALSVQCFAEDVADACGALEAFLALRCSRGPSFFGKLSRIDVAISGELDALDPAHDKAAERLMDFCRNIHLTSFVPRKRRTSAGDRLRSNSCAF